MSRIKFVYIPTSLGNYYLIYKDGVFIGSCDEGEKSEELHKLGM